MRNSYEEKSQWLQERLLSYDNSLKKRVEQTFKNFNTTIRGHIRTETALRLGASADESNISVPVRVIDDFPICLKTIIQDLDPNFLELLLKQSLLKTTSTGLDFVDERVFDLADLVRPTWGSEFGFMPEEVSAIRLFIDRALKVIEQIGILHRLRHQEDLLNIESELLGAYYFEVPEIHLYWPAIALIAIELDVSVEALTLVTLTHELVHAYTHLGQDTDNDRWNTEIFARTGMCQ
ncbi:MAG: hypothetical protein ACKO24_02550 [Leptolyngbyaceae cyanobacterium]